MSAVETDPVTGLPPLPDGQFWEVRRWAGRADQFQVRICGDWVGGDWETIESKIIFGLLSERAVRDAAVDIAGHAEREAKYREIEARLLGIYPPNALS